MAMAYPPSPGQELALNGFRATFGEIPPDFSQVNPQLPALLLNQAVSPLTIGMQPSNTYTALATQGQALPFGHALAAMKKGEGSYTFPHTDQNTHAVTTPQDLARRIEALHEKNLRLRSHHESVLHNASSSGTGLGLRRNFESSTGGTPRGVGTPIGTPRGSALSSRKNPGPLDAFDADVERATAAVAAALPKPMPKLQERTESLAQRLREFRGILGRYMGGQDPIIPRSMPGALQPPLRQQSGQLGLLPNVALSDQVARLQQQEQFERERQRQEQMQLERQQMMAQQLGQLAVAERQAAAAERAAAEKLAAENRLQMQQLEVAAMLNQQHHQQRLLELETALLEQSALRERELQAQLRELDEQFEEVEAVDSRIKMRAAEVAELASNQALDVERRLLIPSNGVWPPVGPTGAQGQSVISPSSSAPTFLPSISPVVGAPSLPLTASSSGTQLIQSTAGQIDACAQTENGQALPQSDVQATWPHMRATGSSSSLLSGDLPQGRGALGVPTGLPRVYEAAVSIILQHGWEILHGGENSGPAWTALHWAASEGRLDVCELLLLAKADAGHQDELGKTALDYALENGQRGAAAILTSLPETEVCRPGARWSPPLNHEVNSEGAQFVAALARQGTWPRDEQRV